MKIYRNHVAKPMNTKQKGVEAKYNDWRHNPKYKDKVQFKRPRTVRKLQGQVVLTSKGAQDATVYLIRVQAFPGVFAEYYMARTCLLYTSDAADDTQFV